MMKSGSPIPSGPAALLQDLPATSGERRASGKAARKRVRRSTLGSWVEADRGHDALETILAQNKIRVPELVPIRHQRMAASPWNYYRGAAAVMAADLACQPDSGLTVQLGGDAHVLNFGLWATPERNLSFDLRDFDETLPGPFEWDVKRFAASLVVAARENGIKPATAAASVTAGVEAYRSNHGERVINGKRMAQSATDIFVGWGSLHERDYYIRQFRDMKIIPTTELIAPRLAEFATACGGALARAHARTGDPVAIDSYIGKGRRFTAEISRFANLYADQNERDHAQLVKAIAAGTVQSLPA